ncbi:polysaccharide biosynthesis/export family protein [Terricaulis silvestris]|uniref:Polysialic acid transport protein KpsD n=1 Tax=Terricaulis silvestris TaxID=2686094 RepID=A0A6I6MP88_9CAUL|nr:polysaccharide biosynthesis/export family protein [Terricaulis silvestris]QGZ93372.1 Polysialic acid transport protein KpsD precursor [Terricaulis silvestris]
MWANSVRRLFACALVLLCAACASDAGPVRQTATGATPVAEYRLGPGDKVRVNVFGEADLSGEFVVSPTGNVSYPLVGEVPASGQTVPEFTLTLTEVLRNGYVREPLISVEVVNYRPYYIMGEVGSPGTFPFTGALTVMNAVATAGGFTYRADTRRVYIKHADAENEELVPLTSTTLVQPGDTIRIPERRF